MKNHFKPRLDNNSAINYQSYLTLTIFTLKISNSFWTHTACPREIVTRRLTPLLLDRVMCRKSEPDFMPFHVVNLIKLDQLIVSASHMRGGHQFYFVSWWWEADTIIDGERWTLLPYVPPILGQLLNLISPTKINLCEPRFKSYDPRDMANCLSWFEIRNFID